MTEQEGINQSMVDFDREHLWHPYTSLTNPLPVYPVVAAKGTQIELADGRKLLDGMSSWWSTIHGYNHPRLNKAAADQLQKMSHVMFGGITHEPAIKLGQLLVNMTPASLEKVFLCDSGSISVEVAMKMAIQYQHAKGRKERASFMTLKKGYHGDTTGAMSVCDPVTGMHHLFRDFMPKHVFMEAPEKGFNEQLTDEEKEAIRMFFAEHADKCAAFILEPIVQGAGGMRVYSPQYLQLIHALCQQHELLLIADEIATGFGRTGKLFAVEHAGICPDIMCLGKAITGGYMTLAATLCTQHVSDTICNGEAGVMMHGPTFMGNPLACAVAGESLRMLLQTDWEKNIARIEHILKRELSSAEELEQVEEIRVLGAIGVMETKQPVDMAKMQAFFVEKGIWIRPFRKLIYIMPPYIMTESELIQICEVMIKAVQQKELFSEG